MGRAKKKGPTPAQMQILRVLWVRGPCTVRTVHETLNRGRSGTPGYTTTLKQMQIMAEQGFVKRDQRQRSHVYTALVNREKTQRKVVRQVLDRLFEGSAAQLVVQALSAAKTSKRELEEIRRTLDELERKRKR